MLKGNANHSKPTHATDFQSARATGFLAAGNSASVANPMHIRTNATPFGPMERSPSAIKRKEAPQMSPGMMRSSQPLVNCSMMSSIQSFLPNCLSTSPPDEQDAIASQILASLTDEQEWKERFAAALRHYDSWRSIRCEQLV